MRIALKATLVAAGLFLAAPAASAMTSNALPRVAIAEGGTAVHDAAAKHHRKRYKRRGCRLVYGTLLCGGSKYWGGSKRRHGMRYGNRHGGKRH